MSANGRAFAKRANVDPRSRNQWSGRLQKRKGNTKIDLCVGTTGLTGRKEVNNVGRKRRGHCQVIFAGASERSATGNHFVARSSRPGGLVAPGQGQDQ